MNTKHTNQECVDFFADIFNPKGDDLIESNARLLMGQYLIQIEKTLAKKSITQKELARKIGVSASYLSQCFNLNKLINFKTLAKIELALNISFKLKLQYEKPDIMDIMDIKNFTSHFAEIPSNNKCLVA